MTIRIIAMLGLAAIPYLITEFWDSLIALMFVGSGYAVASLTAVLLVIPRLAAYDREHANFLGFLCIGYGFLGVATFFQGIGYPSSPEVYALGNGFIIAATVGLAAHFTIFSK